MEPEFSAEAIFLAKTWWVWLGACLLSAVLSARLPHGDRQRNITVPVFLVSLALVFMSTVFKTILFLEY